MDALNALRAVLVLCALVAALILATQGMWVPAAVLGLGIAAHLSLFVHQRNQRKAQRSH
ncbi:MAG: hypothetical protein WD576_01505 [Nitriliruptoraceae bacterium]